MRELLTQGGALLWFIGQFAQEADDKARLLASVNLATEDGRQKAVQLQGTVRGLNRAIDIVFEALQEQDNG